LEITLIRTLEIPVKSSFLYYYYKNRTRSTQFKKGSKHYNTMQKNIRKEKNTQFKNDENIQQKYTHDYI